MRRLSLHLRLPSFMLRSLHPTEVVGIIAKKKKEKKLVSATPTIRTSRKKPDDMSVDSNIDVMHGYTRQKLKLKHQMRCRHGRYTACNASNSDIFSDKKSTTIITWHGGRHSPSLSGRQAGHKVKAIRPVVRGVSRFQSTESQQLFCGHVCDRDGPKVRFWHSAEAEGLGRLTERVPKFGRMLCSRMKQRLLLPRALNGQEMS